MMKEKWTVVSTNKLVSGKEIKPTKAQNILKNVNSKSYDDLKKVADKHYNEKITRENSLIQAYEDKKLKSKTLIKEAKSLKAARDKANKAKQNKESAATAE